MIDKTRSKHATNINAVWRSNMSGKTPSQFVNKPDGLMTILIKFAKIQA